VKLSADIRYEALFKIPSRPETLELGRLDRTKGEMSVSSGVANSMSELSRMHSLKPDYTR
jgi:hypothetical protein